VPGYGYGLGLEMIETPSGRLVGHGGATPGFHNIVLNTQNGRGQLGVMMNEEFATLAVYQAFNQAWMAIAERLLEGAPVGGGSTTSSLRAAVQAGESARAAQALARAGVAVHAQH
jgi:hypothetical protein